MLTKDIENGWGPGKGQRSESGFGNERVKSSIFLSKKWLDC